MNHESLKRLKEIAKRNWTSFEGEYPRFYKINSEDVSWLIRTVEAQAKALEIASEALEIAYTNGCESEKDWKIISSARNKFKEWK